MKATAQSLTESVSVGRSRFSVLSDLVKARLTFLVLLTTLVGFYVGFRGPMDYGLMLHTLVGTGLIACGAAALNQWWEREHDAQMRRTRERPLPSGQMQPETALIFGGVSAVVGVIYLALAVNLVTSFLGAVTLASYVFVYTPLKRITTLNTVIGAVPGGLPPLMGWTAARGEIAIEGWSLFAIIFFWQMPHFLAIAWMYRDEYERAGFVMLPMVDVDGSRTGRQAVSHALGLLFVSLSPAWFGLSGVVYFFGALILGAGFVWFAVQFSRDLTLASARKLFFASIIYLPLLMGLMALDKIKH
jgi:protoheme IX farnesyltransferase